MRSTTEDYFILLEDLPDGTILRSEKTDSHITTMYGKKRYQEVGRGKLPKKNHWDDIDDLRGEDRFVHSSEEIIYPYGYQSPLWKVLNGEEV